MKQQINVPAEIRTDAGKGASRRLRREGKIPAIVYGAGREPVQLAVDHDFLIHAAEKEAFHSSVLELQLGDGRSQKVVLRDLQRHPFKAKLIHADFLRISEDHVLRIAVPIHFVGEEHSPAGREGGVVISHQVTEVEIEALPRDLPEYLEVDLSALEPGDSVMLSQIALPEGVRIPALEISEDNDVAIAAAIYIRAGQGTGELAAEADAALTEGEEPELAAEAEAETEEEAEGEGEPEEAAGKGDEEAGKKSE